jgi:putative ABC transport system substrate-binding protein
MPVGSEDASSSSASRTSPAQGRLRGSSAQRTREITRRRASALLGVGFCFIPSGSGATSGQSRGKPTIGYLGMLSPATTGESLFQEFHNGLRASGFVENDNVAIEYLWADGVYERLPVLAASFVEKRVDVIVAMGGTVAAVTAKAATSTIPIVVLSGDDPVRLGLVKSLNRPGGNITGVVQLVVASEGKRLEILHELAPAAAAVTFLANPARPHAAKQILDIQSAAEQLGIALRVAKAQEDGELDAAFAAARSASAAILIAADPFFFARRNRIVGLAAQHALPAMYFFREFVTAGGLASYGSNLGAAYFEVGVYAGRILKGSKPAELPMVQQSDKLELAINLLTARKLGIAVPPALLVIADEVIE